MATDSLKEKRSSLVKRLLVFVGLVIIAFNVIQLLFVTTNAKKDIVAEDLDMYENMLAGYSLALQNDLEGYFKELNGYVHADVMENADLEECYEWIMDPEHSDMRGDFDYVMFSGPDGQARTDLGGITNIVERDYFQAIMQNGADQYVDNPVIGKTTGLPVAHICRALKDKSGRTFAMITGVININRITEEISKIKISSCQLRHGYRPSSDRSCYAEEFPYRGQHGRGQQKNRPGYGFKTVRLWLEKGKPPQGAGFNRLQADRRHPMVSCSLNSRHTDL